MGPELKSYKSNTRKSKSKTRYAILGILTHRECSGYDIKKFIENSIGFFWQESFGQIYPTLKTLESEGKIETVEENNGDKTRLVHKITPSGRKELKAWLKLPPEPEVIRNEMLLKLFFANEADPGTLIANLKKELENKLQILNQYKEIQTSLQNSPKENPNQIFWNTTLDYGMRAIKMEIEWMQETIQLIGKNYQN